LRDLQAAALTAARAADAAPYIAWAEGLVAEGDLARATNAYRVALRFDPRSLVALTGLGTVLLKIGDLAEARLALLAAWQHYPEDTRTARLLGELFTRMGRYSTAASHFMRAASSEAQKRSS
jgi:Flp pilus assembly protein TadD